MNKIQFVSRLLRIFFQLNFIILPVLFVCYWITAPKPLYLLAHSIVINLLPKSHLLPSNFPIIQVLSPVTKIVGFFISMIPAGFYLFACYFLAKLFRSYEENDIFSFKNVKFIRNISYIFFWSQLIGQPIYQALLSLALTWNNHPRFLLIGFDQTNFGILFASLLIILISWIMLEGYKLREEQNFTI